MQHNLVFHWYMFPDENVSLKTEMVHLYFLSRYSRLFDTALFVISSDNPEDESELKRIRNLQHRLIDAGYNSNTTFKIVMNTPLREAETFNREVVDKFNDVEGITFFAHSKGVSNEQIESTWIWIALCYYMSLEYIDECDEAMEYNGNLCMYGSIPMENKDEKLKNRYDWWYNGTFMWLYGKRITELSHAIPFRIPRMVNRFYGEHFPGNIFNYDFGLYTGSHLNRKLYQMNGYYDFDRTDSFGFIKFILGDSDNEVKKFFETYDESITT